MIKKLAPYTKGYRLLMLFAIACSAGEAVLELPLPQVMSDIVDIGIANGDRGYILMAGLKMVIMALLALGCGVGAAALAAKASMGFGAALRKAEYEQVQRFSFANIERFSTASLVTRLTNDVASVQMTTFMGMRMLVRAPTMLVTALVMALIISTRLSQVFLVVIPLLVIAVVIVIKRVGPFFTSLQGATDQLNLVVQEDLNAIRVVKSFVREAQEKEKFTQRSEKLRSMAERAFGFVVLFMPVMMILMGGTITAVMWIGGHYVWEGTLLSGDLIAFFTYVSEILMSLMMVSVVLMMLTRAIACGKRIAEVLEEKPRITDEQADPALKVEDGSIRFDHVYFKYHDTAEAWNLEDVSFTVPSGATVGILGGTGSAKTTLVSMIPRLYDVNGGAVYVGGHNVKDYTMEALRDGCAMVLQKNTLFSGTIRENLRWGDENASDQEIEAACRLACADEFIEKMPDGYDTYIEQGGTNVSGGQKQRVSLAGVMVDQVKILLFDEPLANLDPATGKQAIELIDEIQKKTDTTVLIIEHRLEDVLWRNVDRIVLVNGGTILADLRPDELLSGSLLAENGIREPLYVTALRYAGVDITPDKHPAHVDSLVLDDTDTQKLRDWFTARPPPAAPPELINPARPI